jgi:hypothetical protein
MTNISCIDPRNKGGIILFEPTDNLSSVLKLRLLKISNLTINDLGAACYFDLQNSKSRIKISFLGIKISTKIS